MLPCGRLRFERSGAGPDAVFLHGLLGSAAQWRGAAAGLAARFTCWLLELPGISHSTRLDDATLPGLRRWLEAAIAGLGLDGFHLIGSSWGGALALEFAAASPLRTRLRRLALVAPAHPHWTPSARQRLLLTPPWTRLGGWLVGRLSPAVHRAMLARIYGDPARLNDASVADYSAVLHQSGLGGAVAGYARCWRADQRRLEGELGQVSMPTLLLWGARDNVVPAATAGALRVALPHAALQVLPGLGHIPFNEDPAAFDQALLPFLLADL
ncbi:MAG: alpha/beta fold hydrolase [Terriglobales bacterium]